MDLRFEVQSLKATVEGSRKELERALLGWRENGEQHSNAHSLASRPLTAEEEGGGAAPGCHGQLAGHAARGSTGEAGGGAGSLAVEGAVGDGGEEGQRDASCPGGAASTLYI